MSTNVLDDSNTFDIWIVRRRTPWQHITLSTKIYNIIFHIIYNLIIIVCYSNVSSVRILEILYNIIY